MLPARTNRRTVVTAAASVFLVFLLGSQLHLLDPWAANPQAYLTTSFPEGSAHLPCHSLPGANDTLVILKTGAGEIEDKLPIHLETTFRCYPNFIIFSDWAETFRGNVVFDALEDVGSDLKDNHEDFDLYRRLQRGGRAALAPSELSGQLSRPPGAGGKPSNAGWNLDKYKFLPMVRRTLEEHPAKKWYLFIETDTYILWNTLLAYISALDATKPYYVGGQTWIGDVLFAHGGTGFIVSRPALEMVVKEYIDHKSEWETFTKNHWAGDCVLGKAFKDSGVPLTEAWPIWQGDDIGNMNYDRVDNGVRRQWCAPTAAYHHISPPIVRDLWEFEQQWTSKKSKDEAQFLRHRDVFGEYILPRTLQERTDWDNHSDKELSASSSPDDCRALCEQDKSCLQWAVSPDSKCLSTSRPNLGESSEGTHSGWISKRMWEFYDTGPHCDGAQWIV